MFVGLWGCGPAPLGFDPPPCEATPVVMRVEACPVGGRVRCFDQGVPVVGCTIEHLPGGVRTEALCVEACD
jgi:hypothetical protein